LTLVELAWFLTKIPGKLKPSPNIVMREGSLPDDVFLGALMAVCVYSKYDLIENLFASKL